MAPGVEAFEGSGWADWANWSTPGPVGDVLLVSEQDGSFSMLALWTVALFP